MSHTAHHAVAHPSAAGEATHEQQDQQNPAQGTQKDLQTIAHRTNLQTIDVIEPLAKRFLSPAYVEILPPRSVSTWDELPRTPLWRSSQNLPSTHSGE